MMRTAGLAAEPALGPQPSERSDSALAFRQRVAEIVGTHTDIVFRTLRRLGVPEADADDGVQQVFVTLARRVAEVRPGAERAFVVGTAVRVAADYRRTRRRRRDEPSSVPVVDVSDARAPSPEGLLDQKQGLALLDAMLARLPDEQRAVFVLFEVEGFTTAEISELIGVRPGTVSSRLHRARAAFEALCAERERTR
ncbi:MAG TPA: sigma-70 family RNA polymerase sigma factor [Polyangiaceae bacterium]